MIAPGIALAMMLAAGGCLAFTLVVLVWMLDRNDKPPHASGFMVGCPPCHGDCRQGRDCPHRNLASGGRRT